MDKNKHYPILTVGPAASLSDADETAGVAIKSASQHEPTVQFAPGVPNPGQDPQGFRNWLKEKHAQLNGRQHG